MYNLVCLVVMAAALLAGTKVSIASRPHPQRLFDWYEEFPWLRTPVHIRRDDDLDA